MKVKTTIIFEVEYSLNLEFYETDDEEKAVEREQELVSENPVITIDSFAARSRGTFTTKVEAIKDPSTGNVRKTWVDGTCTVHSTGTTEV